MKNEKIVSFAVLMSLLFVFCMTVSVSGEPVLHLSFEQGLMPDIGPGEEVSWAAAIGRETPDPPVYSEDAIYGRKSLTIDQSIQNLGIHLPEAERLRGTLLFWVKEPAGTIGSRIINSWGPGWSAVGRDSLQNSAESQFLHPLRFPALDTEWTQFGISWDNRHDEKGNPTGRVRIYRNGARVQEAVGFFSANRMVIGADSIPEGRSRMLDNIRLWDRVLSDSEVKALYHSDYKGITEQVLSVPFLEPAPGINGKIDPTEWQKATRVTGLIEHDTGELALDQSAFYIGYDNKYLYIAMHGEMTELARTSPAAVYEHYLRSKSRGFTPDVADDDFVDIILAPGFWEAGEHSVPGNWQEYRILCNSTGGYHSLKYGQEGKSIWDAALESASSVSNEGWQFEARIPLSSFDPLPSARDAWGIQLGRAWKQLKESHDVIVWGRRVSATNPRFRLLHMHEDTELRVSNLGLLRFGGKEDISVRIHNLGNPGKGYIDFSSEIINPGTTASDILVKLFTDTGELSHQERLSIEPGASKAFSLQHDIHDFGASRLIFEVFGSDDTLIHRTETSFRIEQSFEFRLAQFPNYERFLAALNLGVLSSTPLEDIRVDIQIEDTSGKVVYENKGIAVASYAPEIYGDTSGFEIGRYTLKLTVRGPKEAVLASEETFFHKIEKAPWWDNRYGYDDIETDIVPYPWTDMEVSGDTVSVWGREYKFGTGLLPEQVTTLGRPVLRSPMRVLIKTGAGTGIDTSQLQSQSEWTLTNKTRVEGSRKVEAAPFTIANNFWAEYDGLVYCNITLEPSLPVEIEFLQIEIPATEEFSDIRMQYGFGNGDGGMQIYQENNTFFLEDKKPVSLDKEDGIYTWRMTLVDKPTLFDGPYEITLGFMAAPGRPKTWRTPEYQAWDRRPSHYGFAAKGGGPFYPKGYEALPAPDPEGRGYGGSSLYVWTYHVSTTVDAAGTDDYGLYGAEWTADPFQKPLKGWNNMVVRPEVTSKSLRDWFVWRYWRYQQNYGFNRLYWDNPHREGLYTRDLAKRLYNIHPMSNRKERFFPPDNNPYRSHTVGGAANGFIDLRFMNFWNYHWDGEHLNGVIAQWRTYIGNITPDVFRSHYMGHNYGWPVMFLGQGRIKQDMADAHGGAELVHDHLAGLAMLHDMGGNICCHAPGVVGRAAYRRWYEALDRHSFRHWAYQFLPYWHQDIARPPRDDMYISFYIGEPSKLINATDEEIDRYFERYQTRMLPEHMKERVRREVKEQPVPWRDRLEEMNDKVFLIFYNHSEWEGEIQLDIKWDKLGLGAPETLSAENAVHCKSIRVETATDENGNETEQAVFFDNPEEYAKIVGNTLVFPVTKWNYRMIVIERKQ